MKIAARSGAERHRMRRKAAGRSAPNGDLHRLKAGAPGGWRCFVGQTGRVVTLASWYGQVSGGRDGTQLSTHPASSSMKSSAAGQAATSLRDL